MPIRDDSAGSYGQWNSDDLSWLDFVKAKSSDIGGGAYNALANITGALSPIGTSREGNMAFQVPPMVTGLSDSLGRLVGTPNEPGNAWNISGVQEFDAPIQQDMNNVLLSTFGAQAFNPLRGRAGAAKAALPMDDASRLARAKELGFDTEQVLYRGGFGHPTDTMPLGTSSQSTPTAWFTPSKGEAEIYQEVSRLQPEAPADGVPLMTEGYIRPGKQFVVDRSLDYGRDANGHLMYDPTYWDRVLKSSKDFGYDSVLFKDVLDMSPIPHDQVAVFDPANIRSTKAAFDPARAGDNGLLLSDNKPSIFGSALATAGEQPKGITAYHGSPHDFDKFSLDKIGTGEGAQAYGHGLYFAENEGVARSYRDSLAGKTDYQMREMKRGMKFDDAWTSAARMMLKDGMKPDEVAGILKSTYKSISDDGVAIAMHEANPGKMYQVRINADPESFLDWDKPLSQQSEGIRNALNPYGIGAGFQVIGPDGAIPKFFPTKDAAVEFAQTVPNAKMIRQVDPSGGQVIESSKLVPGSHFDRVEASAKLREAGIPGIRYLDQGSRTAGEGSSNYVVFDDSLIEILKKYGMAGGALGAGAMAQPDSAAAQDIPDWLKF